MDKKILIVCHDSSLSGANLSLCDYLEKSLHVHNTILLLPRENLEFQNRLSEIGVNKILIANVFIIFRYLYKISFKQKIHIFKRKIYNFLFYKSHIKNIIKILKSENIDFVISNSSSTTFGYEIAKRLNLEHVYHIREFMELDHQITYPRNVKIKSIFSNSHAIFISHAIRDYYLQKYNFKSWDYIFDTIKYDENYKRDRLYFENGKINILIAGTLQNNKGQLEAIKAVQKLQLKYNNISLYICGDGPNKNLLGKYIFDNNLNNIYLLGHRNDLVDIRKNIDIALICSSMEALGRVTVESMYYENIVIGANTGETKYLIDENRGFSYKLGDIDDLANKIETIIKMKNEKLNEMADKSKEYALHNFNTNKDIIYLIINLINKYKLSD